MEWVKAVQQLRAGRRPGVLVTVLSVRGHAPREAGAKMVVASDNVWSTVGGGNLEALAVERSREMIADGVTAPEVLTAALSDKAPYQHGVQCCGGEVKLLLEPLPVVPSVAIFGVGHVGLELARILARHDIELHLVDSRPDQLTADRLAVLDDAIAQVHVHNVPVLPELVVGELPPGTHAVIMTHDHAEDAALCDAAIRNDQLATIGLIGSSAKWTRFQRKLTEDGNPADAIARITTPIGLPDLPGKEPAVIAVSVAAWLLQQFHAERAAASAQTAGRQTVPARSAGQTAPAQREAKA
ncbi:xanthine dehydrogenase accessory protein XdhC [Kribbella sp. NPDC026611]|uniref:xanthine dehydrogenase accessory protein XdhC n=1 Tax=Kribbella sp. NPDC026611 TaxID=3154911 RepID=UPI0034046046